MSSINRGIMSDIEARSPGGRIIMGICLMVMILISVAVIFPFIFTFTAGLKNSTEIYKAGLWPEVPMWGNYVDAWQRFNMPQMFLNTIIAAGGGVLLQILISSMAAYFLSRLRPVGTGVVMVLVLITMTVPRIAYIVPLYTTLANLPILNISLVNSFWGLWLPYAVNPFMILVLKYSFDAIPVEIYDAAQMDGASNTRLFFQFTLPLSKTIILVLGLLAFIGLWGDFLLPLLVLRDSAMQTVSVRLFTLTRAFPINLHLAGSFIAMLPPLIAAVILSRYMKGGLTF